MEKSWTPSSVYKATEVFLNVEISSTYIQLQMSEYISNYIKLITFSDAISINWVNIQIPRYTIITLLPAALL